CNQFWCAPISLFLYQNVLRVCWRGVVQGLFGLSSAGLIYKKSNKEGHEYRATLPDTLSTT
ncbi:MAG: hypothetical protein RLN82_07215, partial [Pseudomonadales bacterium]